MTKAIIKTSKGMTLRVPMKAIKEMQFENERLRQQIRQANALLEKASIVLWKFRGKPNES